MKETTFLGSNVMMLNPDQMPSVLMTYVRNSARFICGSVDVVYDGKFLVRGVTFVFNG